MNIFLLAQTDGSVGNRLFGSADSFLENRTEGSAKPIIRSDTIRLGNLAQVHFPQGLVGLLGQTGYS